MTQSRLQKVSGALLLLVSLAAFAPIYPRLPENVLDPSWMLAMNQAVAQGLVFGRDIVFTYGPYSALFTQAYHPATYGPALLLGCLLGLCYGALLLMAARRADSGWLLALAGFLLLLDARDTLFFSYPLLLVLVAYQATTQTGGQDGLALATPGRTLQGPRHVMLYALAFALLGVLPITKGSFLPLAALASFAAFALFWQRGARAMAALCIVLPTLSMAAAWRAAGQPLPALLDYFRSLSPIVSGYSQAMAIYPSLQAWWVTRIGVPSMIVAYVLIAALLLRALARLPTDSPLRRVVMVTSIGGFLLFAFKAGFVRHDAHAVAAGASLALLVLIIQTMDLVPLSRWTVASALLAWLLIHGIYLRASVQESPLAGIGGLLSGQRMGDKLQSAYNDALLTIRQQSPIQQADAGDGGGTDIYPHELAALIASGKRWAPRPVPQSYSAYTPQLARLNAAHLLGPQAPERLVFRVDAIDNRYPSAEDGLSWPILLSHYALADQDGTFLYFKRRSSATAQQMVPVLQSSPRQGESVPLPQQPGVLFAQMRVQPTLLGRVADALFKTSPLYLTVECANGQSHSFSFIAGMAEGFILSPLIQSNADVLQLVSGSTDSPDPKRVQSFHIAPAAGWSLLWQERYTLQLFSLQSDPNQLAKAQ